MGFAVWLWAGGALPERWIFTKSEMDALAQRIGAEPADVDVGRSPQATIALAVELGRRDARLQWAPEAWQTLLGYRRWAAPTYPAPGTYRIVLYDEPDIPEDRVVLRTRQYILIGPPAASAVRSSD